VISMVDSNMHKMTRS